MSIVSGRAAVAGLAAVALAAVLAGGCTSTHTAQQAKGTGTVRVLDASFDEVWAAVPEGLTDYGATVVEVNEPSGYVVATRAVTTSTYGERVAVFVERVDASHTRVEVVSRDYLTATQVTSNSVEGEIMNVIYDRVHR